MDDVGYGAVLRPEWAVEMVRSEHPVDGSRVYTVHEAVAAEAASTPGYSPAPLLLLHGVGNNGAVWGPVLSSLASVGPVIAPTMSPELLEGDLDVDRDGPDDEHRRAVGQLVDWLAALAPPPWRLVGHSMGGVLTGLIMRTHPETVSSAVLLNAPLPGTVTRLRSRDTLDRNGRALLAMKGLAQVTRFGRPRLPRFLRGTELAIVRTALRGFVHDPGALDTRVISRAILRSRTTDGVDFLRLARGIPPWESDPCESNPITVILGGDDPLVPVSDHAAIARAYPAADIHVLADCGHFAHLEQPGPALELIAGFFAATAAV